MYRYKGGMKKKCIDIRAGWEKMYRYKGGMGQPEH